MAKSLEAALAQVAQDRRGFLKALIIGSAVAAVPLMTTQALAQTGGDGQDPNPDGKCSGDLIVNKKGKCAVAKKKGP